VADVAWHTTGWGSSTPWAWHRRTLICNLGHTQMVGSFFLDIPYVCDFSFNQFVGLTVIRFAKKKQLDSHGLNWEQMFQVPNREYYFKKFNHWSKNEASLGILS
jgi:hypothetical protein